MASMTTKPSWKYASKYILEEVFNNVPAEQLQVLRTTSTHWNNIIQSNSVWAKKVREKFGISKEKKLAPHAKSWFDEYKRLSDHTPNIETQKLHFQSQINHIGFSEDGTMFVTCCMDGPVTIWNTCLETELYTVNMLKLGWFYPCFAKLNKSNTKLLVAGAYREPDMTLSGISAMFSLEVSGKLDLNFSFENAPSFTYGIWFCDQYFLSGYMSYNETGSRLDMICLTNANSTQKDVNITPIYTLNISNRNALSNILVASMEVDSLEGIIDKSSSYYDKLLIYRSNISGTDQYLVGFKKFRNMEFFKNLDKELSIEEVFAYRKNHPANDSYDTEDKVIMVDGTIFFMSLCPTNRYLYINTKKLLERTEQQNIVQPRSSKIIEYEIDLLTLEIMPTPFTLFEAHIQPNGDEKCSTHIDVSNHFILSGGVERPACLLERHYGVCLAQLPLNSLFNYSVINRNDEEMLITAENETIRIYRSRHMIRKLKLDLDVPNKEPKRITHLSYAESSIVIPNTPRIPRLNSLRDFPALR